MPAQESIDWAARAWWIAKAGAGGWPGWVLGGAAVSAASLAWLAARFETAARTPGK